MTPGWQGAPYFRGHGRELVSKPVISLNNRWGSYRGTIPECIWQLEAHVSIAFISWLSRIENANLSYKNGQLSMKSDNYRPFKAVPWQLDKIVPS